MIPRITGIRKERTESDVKSIAIFEVLRHVELVL